MAGTTKKPQAWKVFGISELQCWLGHKNPTASSPTGHDAEDCLDAHLACGIRHVAWDLGRSVLNYHSDLPDATSFGLHKMPIRYPKNISVESRLFEQVLKERCQLRAAIRYAHHNGMVLYGRLCMNRHYSPGTIHRSWFAQEHPHWCEVDKDGWLDLSRLCYGIPEYRSERIAILMEAVKIGVDGLCLDFCRQPPMVRYHPVFVNGYKEKSGCDARELTIDQKDAFMDWCRYRAESVTHLLRELKKSLNAFYDRFQKEIPVQVRIPNDGFEANLIAGLDVPTWCEEGLIDELALSELHWLSGYQEWDDRPYIELGKKHNMPVYASSNCIPPQSMEWHGKNYSGEINPRGVNPLVLARRTLNSYEAGAQGISLYQSDTGVQWPGVRDVVSWMCDPQKLRLNVNDREFEQLHPITEANCNYGRDNHSAVKPDHLFRKY